MGPPALISPDQGHMRRDAESLHACSLRRVAASPMPQIRCARPIQARCLWPAGPGRAPTFSCARCIGRSATTNQDRGIPPPRTGGSRPAGRPTRRTRTRSAAGCSAGRHPRRHRGMEHTFLLPVSLWRNGAGGSGLVGSSRRGARRARHTGSAGAATNPTARQAPKTLVPCNNSALPRASLSPTETLPPPRRSPVRPRPVALGHHTSLSLHAAAYRY